MLYAFIDHIGMEANFPVISLSMGNSDVVLMSSTIWSGHLTAPYHFTFPIDQYLTRLWLVEIWRGIGPYFEVKQHVCQPIR